MQRCCKGFKSLQAHTQHHVVVCRADLQAYTKTKTDEIVNLNNTISRLKKELETYEAESYAQETKKDYSLQVASQKTLEYGQASSLKACFCSLCQASAPSDGPQQALHVLLLQHPQDPHVVYDCCCISLLF